MSTQLTCEYLKTLLVYDETTGRFTRLTNGRGSKTRVGDIAGALDSEGYVVCKIHNKNYKAHRLAWLYVYGTFPPTQIDHVNGCKSDNRLSNIRCADSTSNHHNVEGQRNNTSGARGVCKVKRSAPWRASARHEGKIVTLGYYKTIEDAAAMYRWFAEATRGVFYREPV